MNNLVDIDLAAEEIKELENIYICILFYFAIIFNLEKSE